MSVPDKGTWTEVVRGKNRIHDREPGTIGEASRFAKSYTYGLKNDWFSALKNAERLAMDEAFRAADKCPRTILIQIPFGFHGGVDQVLDGVRVSLCRLEVNVAGGGTRYLKPGRGDGDFDVTSNACQTLVVVTFQDIKLKEEVVKIEKIPFWKKKGSKDVTYVRADKDLRVIDLIKPKITLVVTNFIPELGIKYDDALKQFYSADNVVVEVENGVKKQYIDMGNGDGYEAEVYDGKKYVKLSFDGDLPDRRAVIDGKVQLNLEEVGFKTVHVRMLGKQYACESCGGYECERFYCINKCVYCRRDLRHGHLQSECSERGWVDSNHNRKARDLERFYRDMYTPAIVQGSSEMERRNVLIERDMVNGKVEHKIEKTIDYHINEAKDKVARTSTPYVPMDMTVRKGGRGKGRREDEREEDISNALIEGTGGNKKAKSDGVEIQVDTVDIHEQETQNNMEQGSDGAPPGEPKAIFTGPFAEHEPSDLEYWVTQAKGLRTKWTRGIPTGDRLVFSETRHDQKLGVDYSFLIDKEGNQYLIQDRTGLVVESLEGGTRYQKWSLDF